MSRQKTQKMNHAITEVFWLVIFFAGAYAFNSIFFIPQIRKSIETRSSFIEKCAEETQKIYELTASVQEATRKIVEQAMHDSQAIKEKATKEANERITAELLKVSAHVKNVFGAIEDKYTKEKEILSKEAMSSLIDDVVLHVKQILLSDTNI